MINTDTVNWFIATFDELSKQQLYKILRLRQTVFVVEQQCIYEDLDNLDQGAYHVCAFSFEDELLCYARILKPGVSYQEASITRIVAKSSVRGTGLGRLVVQKSIDYIENELGCAKTRILAQSYLERFYQTLGFEIVAESTMHEGLLHTEMLRQS